MISSIQYGGRITDDFDQLLMDTYAEKYFHMGALAPNYELYKDDRSGFSYRSGQVCLKGLHTGTQQRAR